MSITQDMRTALHGWGDEALTLGLLGLALLAVIVALLAPPEVKLGLFAWMVAP